MKNLRNILLFLFVAAPHLIMANVRLNGLFADHMVIQQKTNIPVWGWADPNEPIMVKCSWGAEASTKANADGTWKVYVKTPKAGGPFQMTIAGKNSLVINDVLSGEVWLCAGQSNMARKMYNWTKDAKETKYQPIVEAIRHEVANANDPWLRAIEVPPVPSMYEKKKDFKANWRMAIKGHVDSITATGYYFAKVLREKLNVPVGLVQCSMGGTPIESWISEEAYLNSPELKEWAKESRAHVMEIAAEMDRPDYVDEKYEAAYKKWEADGKKGVGPQKSVHPKDDKRVVSTLYNGIIAPVVPYAIKGILWYQGEANSKQRPAMYSTYLEALINGLRKDWGQDDLPFYYAQLANFSARSKERNKGWSIVCDQMRRTLKIPHTGMAVLCDIGEAKDVHPHNKIDVGKRLALWALKNDYGVKVPEVSGPLYQSSTIEEDKIIVTFSHAGSGLMVANKYLTDDAKPSKDALRSFQICSANGVWKAANAKIISKDKIEVSSAEVKNPLYVRYAWSYNPEGVNLYNKEGLPAAVFTTEKYKSKN